MADVVGAGSQIKRGNKILWDSDTENLINEQLSESAKSVRQTTNKITRNNTDEAVNIVFAPQEALTIDYLSTAGLDNEVIKKVYSESRKYITDIQFQKTWFNKTTGFSETWSSRVWRVGRRYREDMQTVIKQGLDLGRSPEKIAKDLEMYIRDGRQSLANRYLTLDNSSKRIFETEQSYFDRIKQFKKRIPNNVDYRALRLARSTVQGAFQDANIAQSELNPAIKKFNWNLNPAHYLPSICDDIAPGSPYTYETFGYGNPPHPNCQSFITFIVPTRKEFLNDLKQWYFTGQTQPKYLSEWKSKYYDSIDNGQPVTFPLLLSRQQS